MLGPETGRRSSKFSSSAREASPTSTQLTIRARSSRRGGRAIAFKEESLRLRVGDEPEAQRHLRAGDARQGLGPVCETSELPIVEQGDCPPGGDQHRALVILIDRVAA